MQAAISRFRHQQLYSRFGSGGEQCGPGGSSRPHRNSQTDADRNRPGQGSLSHRTGVRVGIASLAALALYALGALPPIPGLVVFVAAWLAVGRVALRRSFGLGDGSTPRRGPSSRSSEVGRNTSIGG